MNNHLPSSRFSDAFDPAWHRHDPAALWEADHDAATAMEGPIDFDAVPTREEFEANPESGPRISLIDEPHAIALPSVYEHGYAYPLIVWFHDDGGNEEDIFDALPMISDRNYLALALRGNLPGRDGGARWATALDGPLAAARRVEEAVAEMQRQFHVHPQRIYLAGVGSGGTTALEVLLDHPEVFVGAACLCGEFPAVENPLARFRGLRGRRILLSTTLDCPDVKVVDLVVSGRLLYTAGMQVGTRIYQQSGETARAKMFRDVDRWIMDGIASAVPV